jgi:putative flippase GtrA
MIFPNPKEIKTSVKSFIERENITWHFFSEPKKILRVLFKYRFLHFFVTGGTGALLNLGVTWSLTTFVFGLERYFSAFLFGIAVNLTFNFLLYSVVIFQTTKDHGKRFITFVVWSIVMTIVQATIVRLIVGLVGVQWYLFVIAGVILFFAFFNFLIFKLSIFKERIPLL